MRNQHFLGVKSFLFLNLNLEIIWQVNSEEQVRDLKELQSLYIPTMKSEKIYLERPNQYNFEISLNSSKITLLLP